MTADPSPLLAAARQWHDAGYCVVPSHEDGSKRPMGRWKEYTTARPTWDEITGWLSTGRYSGIGIIAGAASGNVELIELEGPMDAAVERLGRVVEQAGQYDAIGMPELLARIARGCVEQSAGGGLHFFIRVTDGPAKGNTKLAMQGDGTDRHVVAETRGQGGFVVVAPTTGRNGHAPGTAYLFINGGDPANTVEVTGEERDMLHLLFTLALHEGDDLAEPEPPRDTPPAPVTADTPFGQFRQRTTWRDILAPLGWREGFTASDGRTHWTRPGGQKFEGTSATTIEDGPMFVFSTSVPELEAEKGHSKEYVYAALHHGGDLSAAARALRDAGYGVTAAKYADLPPWEAELDPDATPDERAEAASSWVKEHLPLLDWRSLWEDETEEEWIVEPLLAKRRLVALYSAPKVGKSLLMLELAAGMACGKVLLGNLPTEPIRTLYIDFENDPRGDVRTRLEAMGYGPDDLDNLCYLSFPTLAKLDTKAGSEQLLAAVEEYGCQVVVIDTVSRSVEGDENENDTWLNFYRHTGLKLKRAEVALIRLDHSGKDETKGQRGGSAKSGDVDAIWRMSRTGDNLFDLICEAARFPVVEQQFTIERVDEPHLRHKRLLDDRKAKMAEILPKLAEAGIPRDDTLSVRAVAKMLKDAGVKYTKAQLTLSAIQTYARQMPQFAPISIDETA